MGAIEELQRDCGYCRQPITRSGRAGQCPQKACAWSLIRSSMTNAGRSSWPIPTVSERSWARDVALEPRRSL
jgi:hypothetical protein